MVNVEPEFELKTHSAVAESLVSRKNQKARLTFAEEHVGWTKENWSKIHFSDESNINLFGKHYAFIKLEKNKTTVCK